MIHPATAATINILKTTSDFDKLILIFGRIGLQIGSQDQNGTIDSVFIEPESFNKSVSIYTGFILPFLD
jgi:hypothetical protein